MDWSFVWRYHGGVTAGVGGAFAATGHVAIGIGIAMLGGAIAGATSEILTQVMNDGKVTDGWSIAGSVIQSACFNGLSLLSGIVAEAALEIVGITIVAGFVLGGFSAIVDLIKHYSKKSKNTSQTQTNFAQ